MDVTKHKLDGGIVPGRLQTIDAPPKELFYKGRNPNELSERPTVTIVGSRKPTPYGREVTTSIAESLARAGVVIVSGLALGVDSIAHTACLDAGGTTIAILPCGIESIYPPSHHHLAKRIIEQGGTLLTEYPEGTPPLRQHFIARNRLVSALGDIVIITEAAERSGTLHTANFALNQGKTIMAVPGPITSALSKGTNQLIRIGALPITSPADVIEELGLNSNRKINITADTEEQYIILKLISEGMSDGHELMIASELSPHIFNQSLTMLEINGQIKPLGNNHWQRT